MTTKAPAAPSVAHATELDMVRDAREVLLADPQTTQAELDRNQALIDKYTAERESGRRDRWTGTQGDTGAPRQRGGGGGSSRTTAIPVSEAQRSYIARLIDEKLPEGDPMREPTLQALAGRGPNGPLTGGREGTASKLISLLQKLPTVQVELATEAQKDKIRWLAPRKLGAQGGDVLAKLEGLSKRDASAAIDGLQKLPDLPRERQANGGTRKLAIEQDGMYRDPQSGEIYKVQVAAHGSGKLYAKRLVKLDQPRELKNGKVRTHDFAYAPGAISQIQPEWRMTLEEAVKWGRLYGACIKCGLVLTKERSIERAMGDTCANRGW